MRRCPLSRSFVTFSLNGRSRSRPRTSTIQTHKARGRRAHGGRDPARPALRGPGRGHRRRRRGGAAHGRRDRLRRDRPRRDDAGPRRLRDLPPAARRRRLGAGADAHRPRRGRGPRARPRRRRRRLPDQAVLAGRADRAAARARSPRPGRAPGRARGRRPAARPGTREVWRGDAEIQLSAREFALLETFMRRPGHVFTQMQLLEAAWDLGYEQRSNVVEVYVRYLREKIDRPFGVARSRRCAAPATGCARTAAREPPADPPAPDRRVRARDGGGAGRRRPVRLPAR